MKKQRALTPTKSTKVEIFESVSKSFPITDQNPPGRLKQSKICEREEEEFGKLGFWGRTNLGLLAEL